MAVPTRQRKCLDANFVPDGEPRLDFKVETNSVNKAVNDDNFSRCGLGIDSTPSNRSRLYDLSVSRVAA